MHDPNFVREIQFSEGRTAVRGLAPSELFFAVFFRSLWVTIVRRKVRWRGRDVPVRRAPAASGEVMQ